ncbi:acyltransferase 3 [Caldalkalibacillus thermarum TA2.A1]|uniref:Acyltransferase n=2 Tax=Caldalkalibacillus TaxID=379065 RepID=F5L995_CALTT|nr:acyltransferase 3 [Caldalkalibacillus thermarum TA2.A1]QZT35227.1 acyltransferase [Caldalkalibacillus thermarum TA2.A1]
MVHSTSHVVVSLNSGSSFYFFYNVLNVFFKFGTPTFILLSSFVLFYNYYSRPLNRQLIWSFYKNRLLYILIPYFIFSLIYFSIKVYPQWMELSKGEIFGTFLADLLKGKAWTHLYFVFISIQFYVLFPLLLLLFKRSSFVVKNAIWIGFVAQWIFVLYNHYNVITTQTGSIAIKYMSYYFLGAYLGIHYDRLKNIIVVTKDKFFSKIGVYWIALWLIWLVSAFGHSYLWYWTRLHGTYVDTKLYELLWNIHTITSAIVIIQFSHWIYSTLAPKITNIAIHLGIVSFGVYLIHPLFLHYYRMIPVNGNPFILHSWVGIGFITALGTSWVVVGLCMKYFSWSWVLFGANVKRNPYKSQLSNTFSSTYDHKV